MKITLRSEPTPDNPYEHVTVVHSTEANTLCHVIEAIEEFLHASGFPFDGKLDIVDEDGVSTLVSYDTPIFA